MRQRAALTSGASPPQSSWPCCQLGQAALAVRPRHLMPAAPAPGALQAAPTWLLLPFCGAAATSAAGSASGALQQWRTLQCCSPGMAACWTPAARRRQRPQMAGAHWTGGASSNLPAAVPWRSLPVAAGRVSAEGANSSPPVHVFCQAAVLVAAPFMALSLRCLTKRLHKLPSI